MVDTLSSIPFDNLTQSRKDAKAQRKSLCCKVKRLLKNILFAPLRFCTFSLHFPLAVFLMLTFSISTALLYADSVTVEAVIEQTAAYANEPLEGTITISHDQSQPVDAKSFLIKNSKLSVELVKEVKIAPNNPLILSIYGFKLPGQPEGLYALPPISVNVGGQTYQSSMSSYSVQARKPSKSQPGIPPDLAPGNQPAQAASSASNESKKVLKPLLRLEASIDGKPALYPGQHTRLVYHYHFTGNIALTVEQLPLLDAAGFIKIGEKEFQDSAEGTVSVSSISQEVEAVKPGKYVFGPSLIEGYSYKEDYAGNPVYTSDKLSSEAPPVVVTVLPFPEKNKPASFNGAVGTFTFKTSLLSPVETKVGDEVSLLMEISGQGNLKNITAPDLCCQPSFSGFFRFSDLPPSEEIIGDVKKITVKLRPLNSLIQAIPNVEFSFFNPETTLYNVLDSPPLPISIAKNYLNKDESNSSAVVSWNQVKPVSGQLLKVSATPPSIQIEKFLVLTKNDLYDHIFGTWWVLTIVPLGAILLIYQQYLKNYLIWQRSHKPAMRAKELLLQFFSDDRSWKGNFDLLKKAFKLALTEARLIPFEEMEDKELPDEGISHEVKVFFVFLEEKRFGSKGGYDKDNVRRLALDLMNKIEESSKSMDKGVSL